MEAEERIGEQRWYVRFGKLGWAGEQLPEQQKLSLAALVNSVGGKSVVSVLVASVIDGSDEPLIRYSGHHLSNHCCNPVAKIPRHRKKMSDHHWRLGLHSSAVYRGVDSDESSTQGLHV